MAVVGNVDVGKSTLLGVLTHRELDNGHGFARQKQTQDGERADEQCGQQHPGLGP